MAQTFNLVVYEFGTTNHIDFDYKIYKRDSTKSYRSDEKQIPAEDLNVWPNSPPVDVNHIFVESNLAVDSPYEVTLDDDESYYIIVWKDYYNSVEKRFYVADPNDYKADATNVGSFPNDLYFELRKMSSNAEVFV